MRMYDLAGERPDAATFFKTFFAELDQALDNLEYFGLLPVRGYPSGQVIYPALQSQGMRPANTSSRPRSQRRWRPPNLI
jgi:hypothetical protein